MAMNRVEELDAWIEGERAGWRARGVDILERGGQKFFRTIGSDGKLQADERIFFGTTKLCKLIREFKVVLGETPFETQYPEVCASDFIPLIMLGDMSFEHAKVLIENAVEQVAGR
jgi:hypothetical protein